MTSYRFRLCTGVLTCIRNSFTHPHTHTPDCIRRNSSPFGDSVWQSCAQGRRIQSACKKLLYSLTSNLSCHIVLWHHETFNGSSCNVFVFNFAWDIHMYFEKKTNGNYMQWFEQNTSVYCLLLLFCTCIAYLFRYNERWFLFWRKLRNKSPPA